MWVMHLTSNLQYNHGSQERKGVDFRYAVLVSNTHNLLNKSSSSSSSLRFIEDRCTGREIDSVLVLPSLGVFSLAGSFRCLFLLLFMGALFVGCILFSVGLFPVLFFFFF
jgi:hypothetical protein